MPNRLIALADELVEKYDLSPETAKQQGTDEPADPPLLNGNHVPRIGGAERKGHAIIDRYITYKLKEIRYGMGVYQPKSQIQSTFYIVSGRQCDFDQPMTLDKLSDRLINNKHLFGQRFDTFEDAANKTREIFEKIAPRRKR